MDLCVQDVSVLLWINLPAKWGRARSCHALFPFSTKERFFTDAGSWLTDRQNLKMMLPFHIRNMCTTETSVGFTIPDRRLEPEVY